MLVNSSSANVASYDPFYGNTSQPRRAATLPSQLRDRPTVEATNHAVEIYPSDIVKRRTVATDGMAAEIVQAMRREKVEFRFRAPLHLLAICDQGARSDGDTYVEGLPRSTLRDVRRKLTFVPAGHEYREWQEPRVLTRVVYFYFNPAKMPAHPDTGGASAPLAPRLFFEDRSEERRVGEG